MDDEWRWIELIVIINVFDWQQWNINMERTVKTREDKGRNERGE